MNVIRKQPGQIANKVCTAPVEWYRVKGAAKAPLPQKGSCHGRKAAMTEGISFFFSLSETIPWARGYSLSLALAGETAPLLRKGSLWCGGAVLRPVSNAKA